MSRRAWVLFALMSLLWGLPYLLIKVAIAEIEPLVLVFLRLALAAAVMLPIALATRSLSRVIKYWRRMLVIGSVGIASPFLLIAYGEQHITSSLAALLIAADPLVIALLALAVDASERATGARLVGLLIGLAGVAVLVGLNVGGDQLGILGAAMVLLATVCYAVSALVVKRVASVSMLGSVTATLSLAALILAPFALTSLPHQVPSPPVIASIVGLGLVCTALGYVIYYSLIAEAGATRGSVITYVNPAVAVLLGVLILHEPLTLATLAGFALIVVGCGLSTGLLRIPRRFGRTRRMPSATSGAELAEVTTYSAHPSASRSRW